MGVRGGEGGVGVRGFVSKVRCRREEVGVEGNPKNVYTM